MRPIDVRLFETCARGTPGQVRRLLDQGADPNAIHWLASEIAPGSFEHCGDHDYPVIQAAVNPDSRVLELLLERGADVNVSDGYLREPLAHAAGVDQYRNVQRLLELGNDPNAIGVDGDTPCTWAATNPSPRVLELLLAHGADPNLGGRGELPLEAALRYGTPDCVRVLVRHGARTSVCDGMDFWLAPAENVAALLECGFDPNSTVRDDDGGRHPLVDELRGEKRALFLRFGAVSADGAGLREAAGAVPLPNSKTSNPD